MTAYMLLMWKNQKNQCIHIILHYVHIMLILQYQPGCDKRGSLRFDGVCFLLVLQYKEKLGMEYWLLMCYFPNAAITFTKLLQYK